MFIRSQFFAGHSQLWPIKDNRQSKKGATESCRPEENTLTDPTGLAAGHIIAKSMVSIGNYVKLPLDKKGYFVQQEHKHGTSLMRLCASARQRLPACFTPIKCYNSHLSTLPLPCHSAALKQRPLTFESGARKSL